MSGRELLVELDRPPALRVTCRPGSAGGARLQRWLGLRRAQQFSDASCARRLIRQNARAEAQNVPVRGRWSRSSAPPGIQGDQFDQALTSFQRRWVAGNTVWRAILQPIRLAVARRRAARRLGVASTPRAGKTLLKAMHSGGTGRASGSAAARRSPLWLLIEQAPGSSAAGTLKVMRGTQESAWHPARGSLQR